MAIFKPVHQTMNTAPNKHPNAKPLWLCLLCLYFGLVGCADSGDDLELKLQAIHQKPVAPMPTQIPTLSTPTQSYTATQDPFVSPLRQRLVADDANANAQPTTTQDKPNADKSASGEQGDSVNLAQNTAKPTISDTSQDKRTAQAGTADDKANQPVRQADKTPPSTPVTPVINAKRVQVDERRAKQTLERFDLAQLRYQGRIEQQGKTQALIASPDGVVHLVGVGEYLGLHHGKVVGIYAGHLHITQAVLHSDGQYYQRDDKLTLR